MVRGIPCPTTILVNCVRGVRCPTLLSFLVSNILKYLHNSVLPTNIAIYFDKNNWFTSFVNSKGQLISKCPYEKSVSSKIPTRLFLDFCPEIFCSFLGASWKLFGLPGDLVSNIINKEGYWKPKKLPGSPQKATKNFRAEIQKYFRWYFGWNWFFIRTFWN